VPGDASEPPGCNLALKNNMKKVGIFWVIHE